MTQEEFSKKFKELFTSMIQVAYDFVDHSDEVEDIYVYSDMEGGMSYFNAFYKINGKVVQMHEVNDVLSKEVETGLMRTSDILDLGIDETDKTRSLFDQYQGKVPSHMKFKFTVASSQFDSDISYDLHHTNTDDLLQEQVFDQWFEEVKNSSKK